MPKERSTFRTWLASAAAATAVAACGLAAPQLVAAAAPPEQARVAADVECTAAAALMIGTGLKKEGEPVTTTATLTPTTAHCTDNRADVKPADRIVGAVITAAEPGEVKGTCASLMGKAILTIDWVFSGAAAEPQQSTVEVSGEVKDDVPAGKSEVTAGLFMGYELGAGVPITALDLIQTACESADGVTKAVAQLTVTVTAKP